MMRYRRCLVPTGQTKEKRKPPASTSSFKDCLNQRLFVFVCWKAETYRVSISISCCRCIVYSKALLVVYDGSLIFPSPLLASLQIIISSSEEISVSLFTVD